MKQYTMKYQLNEEHFFQKMHLNVNNSLNRKIRAVISDLKQLAEQSIQVQAWYQEENGEWHTGIKAVDDCEKKIICLIYVEQTAMDTLEKKQDNDLEKYLLYELINDMLFYTSDQLYYDLGKLYKEKGCCLTAPFFPGENGVSLELQKELLYRMKREKELQIDLNDCYMLVPENALLYVLGADKRNTIVSWKHNCSMCDKIDCYLRKEDKEHFQEES